MIVSVTCSTDRFNLSVVGDDVINECSYGEDFSRWLVASLESQAVEANVVCMEGFGWANTAKEAGNSYLMYVGGVADGGPDHPNRGQWRVMLERNRTLMDKILGKNMISPEDPLVKRVVQILTSAGFSQVVIEL
ncbi:hypothetical protein [Massilia sp. CCM 8734]|uniref:hypothetical protein n=1 Tax=Massilia sp. CCM 8734 TaxID=2609283 RepID=UPI00141F4505|nr:hypothetical protein [Massilia sp. CCM 8734]NHZ97596.1 hypothetical protein [Massilia sp. CCM 8734]